MVPWLKVRCDIHEDLAVIACSISLDVSENEVVGACIKYWSWANRETPDGNAPRVTKAWLDRYVGVAGFSDAMEREGWLSTNGQGIAIPRFGLHNGSSAKARAQTQRRVETCRKKAGDVKRDCNAATVTQPLTVALTNPLPEIEIEEEYRGRNSPMTPSCPETDEDAVSRADEPAPPPDVIITFPCDGKQRQWALTASQVASWQIAYPSLDVLGECRKALAWVEASPERKKTAKGMTRFLVGWLGRAQDSPRRPVTPHANGAADPAAKAIAYLKSRGIQ